MLGVVVVGRLYMALALLLPPAEADKLVGPVALAAPAQPVHLPGEISRQLVPVHWQTLVPLCDPTQTARPQALQLALRPGLSIVAQGTQITRPFFRPETLQWKGSIRGEVTGRVTLSAGRLCGPAPSTLVLAGSVQTSSEFYALLPQPEAQVLIIRIDPTAAALTQLPDQTTSP